MLTKFFNRAELIWHERLTAKLMSMALIVSFLIGLALASLSFFGIINKEISFFISIDIAFTVLLIFEVLGLIFILPNSVADSLGKQFEIFSIILLRSAFKEFGALNKTITLEHLSQTDFYYMFFDAFGALFIFLIIGLYYKNQRHVRITDTEQEQAEFIQFKQVLAIGIFLVFVGLGIHDLLQVFTLGIYEPSINTFYLFLIFADILVLLYSLRYTTRYYNIFRYSSFAFATVLIRMALSAEPIVNVLMGLLAGSFVLGLSYTYNYFMETRSEHEVVDQASL